MSRDLPDASGKPIVWTMPRYPVGRREIARVEVAWGIRFPDEYVEIALTARGGHPGSFAEFLTKLSHDPLLEEDE